jgi:hypothetical protein
MGLFSLEVAPRAQSQAGIEKPGTNRERDSSKYIGKGVKRK